MKRLTRTAAAIAIACGSAFAHDGRRYEVLVSDNMLYARGYISNSVDDGGGVVRPYYNALHGHWENNPSPAINAASGDLPGFDLFEPGDLVGHSLVLTLTGASKWLSPPISPDPSVVPDLTPLDAGEEIFVTYGSTTVSTVSPGSLELLSSVGAGGDLDLDLSYDIADKPSGVLYVLGFELSSPGSGVASSDTVYVILSPDGDDPTQKLHHASLFLEQYLGTPVPSPAPVALGGVFAIGAIAKRRR